VTSAWPYDDGVSPPAPMLPLRLADPAEGTGVLLPALVDTGADCTLVPAAVASRLRLPVVDRIVVAGLGGSARRAPVHAAVVQVGRLRTLARVVAFEEETIVGRDLLNRLIAVLDGPALRLSLRPAGAHRREPAPRPRLRRRPVRSR